MPKKICNQVGCNTLISMNDRYCPEHIRDNSKEKNKSYDEHSRNKKHHKFYNSKEWKVVRTQIMQSYGGLCCQCSKYELDNKADVVDHIIPITVDWNLRLKVSNLQPLCHQCHNRKTANDKLIYRGRV